MYLRYLKLYEAPLLKAFWKFCGVSCSACSFWRLFAVWVESYMHTCATVRGLCGVCIIVFCCSGFAGSGLYVFRQLLFSWRGDSAFNPP